MASAYGSLNGSGNQQVWVYISRQSQNTAGNYSRYYGEVRYYGNGWGSWSGQANSWSANFGGTTYSGTFTIPQAAAYDTYTVLWTGYFNKTHNAAGALSAFSVSASISSSHSSIGNGTASTTEGAPPTIPRASTPSFEGDSSLVTGVAKTINMNRLTTFTHDVRWSFGSLTNQTSGLSTANGVTTSTVFTPPESMLAQIPNNASGSGTITVTTKNGSTTVGSKSIPFTLTANNSVVPTISSITLSDNNATVNSAVGASVFVQGLSQIKAVVNASGVRGSTIQSAQWGMDNRMVDSGQALTPTSSGTVAIAAGVTDSRGRVGNSSQNISVMAYISPKFNSTPLVRRANSSNVVSDEGTYLRLDINAAAQSLMVSSSQKNTIIIKVYTKPYSSLDLPGSWTLRNTINQGTSVTYNPANGVQIAGGGVYSIDQSFDVRIEISDKFRTATSRMVVSTSEIFMHWGPNGTGYGKYHQQGKHDFAGPVFVDGARVRTLAVPAKVSREVITSNKTFNMNPSISDFQHPMYDWTFMKVILIGGGGAGGGVPATSSGAHSTGSGGGGGGYAELLINRSDASGTVSIVIGAGGTGVVGAVGNNGGDTTFGSLLKATGGAGGGFFGSNVNWVIGIPGDGGMGSHNGAAPIGGPAPIYLPGGPGHPGGGMAGLANSGIGGSSQMGYGGGTQYASGAGVSMAGLPGTGYGGGGSGAFGSSSSTAKAGGAGAKGVVIVEYYA